MKFQDLLRYSIERTMQKRGDVHKEPFSQRWFGILPSLLRLQFNNLKKKILK